MTKRKPGKPPTQAERDAKIMALYEAGKTQEQIAAAIGISKSTVGNIVYRHYERIRLHQRRAAGGGRKQKEAAFKYGDGATADELAKYAALPRCKCSLLLPCHKCTPSIEFFATRSTGWTPSDGGV